MLLIVLWSVVRLRCLFGVVLLVTGVLIIVATRATLLAIVLAHGLDCQGDLRDRMNRDCPVRVGI